ncbi:phosphatase PAP2 family protein [Aquimarina sp. RZ0]|uniref:phosphatase PAP2 family protein n=1 Tax=Aquimarina sp. RZ0 TaxID=2607730 RepID=UPI0011F32FE8|nr:phosphatase PAP2 family protein [Aquimarina sp. RZ0]KAA1245652.1 phosphatase PAP2 family protein [Aquimarina sp. RZ0]
MEELIQLDKDLFIYLNNLGTPFWDDFWLFVTEKINQAPLVLILLYFFHKYFGVKGTVITIITIALLITVSDQLSNLFKNVLFMRPRPCQLEGVGEFTRFIAERCGRHGYFSAHASTSMGVAFFTGLALQKKLKYIFPFMVLWSIVFSYSRIYIGVHYPGDIITGMIIGILLGVGTYKLHSFLIAKYNK